MSYNYHMKIDGLTLQKDIVEEIQLKVTELKQKGITPGIAIVTLGEEASWQAYVGQKIKLADRLGINKTLINLNPQTTEEVVEVVERLNSNPQIHGIIVQRPFPPHIDTEKVIRSVAKEKDIDGFRDDSTYEVPVFLAVKHILEHIAKLENKTLSDFLTNKKILVVGKGETAGGPAIKGLSALGFEPGVIDSKTQNRSEKFGEADIIISAVGKTGVITSKNLKHGCILVGVGIHRGEEGLEGDYDEFDIENKTSYYTPTPKGVGPVNLAFLFKNLLSSASSHS